MKTDFERIILLCVLFFISTKSIAQAGITTNGANINISSGTSLVIPGNVKINGTSDYIFNNGTCYITGNFTNGGGAFNTSATGTEIFNGSSSTISASSSTYNPYFNNFIISSGASVTLSNDINVLNNWTNNSSISSLNPTIKTVSFKGISDQTISGNTTFYDLTENQSAGAHLNFAAAQTIVNHNLTISTGTMNPGTGTLVEFTGTGNLAGSNNKTFYDLQIDGTSIMTITSSDVSIAHNFVNNGTYKYTGTSSVTTFSGSSGITQTFTGSATSSTTFKNVVVGDNHPLSTGIILNCSGDYTIQGGGLSLSHNSTLNNLANTVTFSTTSAAISGSGHVYFNNVVSNVNLDFGNGLSSINNILTINNGNITPNTLTYSNNSSLVYNTNTSNYTNNSEWISGSTVGSGVPQNVSVTNTNSVVIGGDRTVPGILSLTSGSLDINNHTLTVTGGFAGAGGNLKGSVTSNLTAGGTGTIYFDATANYLKNLVINGSANLALGNALNITASNGSAANTFGTVTVNSGAVLDATSNGYLTLKSDANGDAVVGNSTGMITGNVTVERYIYAKRAWRFLSIPANSTQSINGAWQEGATPYPNVDNTGYTSNSTYNPKPSYGTEITYGGGNTSLGFDENNYLSKPSCKYWDSAMNAWIPVSTTYMPIKSHGAYCIFIRGNRDINLVQGVGATPDVTVLRTKGTINQGSNTQSFGPITSGNFVMIKNSYASPLDFSKGAYTNMDNNTVYVFDPKLNGSYYVGGYTYYNSQLSNKWLLTTNDGGSYPPGSAPLVQSGQAFFVASTSTMGSVTFDENAKSTTEFNVTGQVTQPYDRSEIFTELLLTNNNFQVADKVAAIYGNKYQKHDALSSKKFWNEDESMSIWDSTYYAISCRPVPTLTDTLFFRLYLYHGTPYTLRVYGQYLKPEMPARAWLVDNYLKTKTEINLYDTTLYSFQTSIDTLSYRNRFMLVFNKQFVANPVPVTKVINQNNPGITGVSNNITVKASGVSIYPNPVSTGKASLQFNNMDKGSYAITVFNPNGERLAGCIIDHSGGSAVYSLLLNPSWAAGVYTINAVNENLKRTINFQLVISK